MTMDGDGSAMEVRAANPSPGQPEIHREIRCNPYMHSHETRWKSLTIEFHRWKLSDPTFRRRLPRLAAATGHPERPRVLRLSATCVRKVKLIDSQDSSLKKRRACIHSLSSAHARPLLLTEFEACAVSRSRAAQGLAQADCLTLGYDRL